MRLDFLIRESDAAYRAHSNEYLTSHQLADFRKCPLLFRKKQLRLIEEEDRPAYLIGRALHTLVLEGRDAFDLAYVVGGPINPKTGEVYGQNTKAYAQWTAASGKEALTHQAYQLVSCMAESVRSHKLAAELLQTGVAEGVVRAHYCDMPCQARLDWLNPYLGIVDLKTCDDLDWFERDACRYGYMHQMAFYQAVLAQVISLRMPVTLIAVEKQEPYRCGVWSVMQDGLQRATRENEDAIARLQWCQRNDVWPTDYEQRRMFAF
jgi:hypothetical protein